MHQILYFIKKYTNIYDMFINNIELDFDIEYKSFDAWTTNKMWILLYRVILSLIAGNLTLQPYVFVSLNNYL